MPQGFSGRLLCRMNPPRAALQALQHHPPLRNMAGAAGHGCAAVRNLQDIRLRMLHMRLAMEQVGCRA
ncbi:g9783 [Coccomyxa viridis]|uniref:G9783 protein n=1 Tax=Coccomyxa viridis TaxID=1274662 RepID=A0ABP1G8D3_9CHLO